MYHTQFPGWEPLITQIETLLHTKKHMIMAVDGRCGSGKSTLAGLLIRHFPARLLCMDDFYLPFPDRAPNWEKKPCGNMDFDRFAREALLPAQANHPILYRRNDCHAGRFLEPVELPATPVTIVEGSYSHHPRLSGYYDFTVFLTCSPDEQLRRLQNRENENFTAFLSRWIPLEERYFALYGIENSASMHIIT